MWVWRSCAVGISLLVLTPLAALVWQALRQPSDLLTDNLWLYSSNTLLLLFGVGVLVVAIGVISAWLIANCIFPGSRVLSWALLLPLAVPSYIAAYVYTDLLEYAGPVQSMIRQLGGFTQPQQYFFPSIRSLGGAIVVMGLVLYPYVYLLMRTTFAEQSRDLYQAARLLGMSRWKVALRVHLPLARPALIAGASLAMLEAGSDFGTVDYFAVATLLTGTFDLWLSLADLPGASRLALILTSMAVLVLVLERYSRRQKRYWASSGIPVAKVRLRGAPALAASCACAMPVVLGFVIPVGVLVVYSVQYAAQVVDLAYLQLLVNSVKLAALVMLVTLALGLLVTFAQHQSMKKNGFSLIPYARVICSLGYATPGAVLAIGMLFPLASVDHVLADWITAAVGIDSGLLLTGSLAALVVVITVRLLAISTGTLEACYSALSPSMDMVAQTLGHSHAAIFWRYHLPLLHSGCISAGLIVFVDTMKELPATLILRPFGFDTLATQAYFYAGDEQIELAALGCLSIVLISALAMLVVSRVEQWRRFDVKSQTTRAQTPATGMLS